jgi:pimeloyl-CoA synthetase
MVTLEDLQKNSAEYNEESQQLIKSLSFAKNELVMINETKRTAGWKLLEEKIREQLSERIFKLVENDVMVQALLVVLNSSASKRMNKILQDEINKILPE